MRYQDLEIGDAIYYCDKEGNHIPGVALRVGTEYVRLKGNFPDGDRITQVKISNVELQPTYN